MILGDVKSGQGQKALHIFHRMQQEDVQPDLVIFLGVLNACASVVALKEGSHVREWIIQSGWDSNVFVGSSLVDMYAKCGNMEDVWTLFTKMPS
jgi:pentatricopeptide repeat protein